MTLPQRSTTRQLSLRYLLALGLLGVLALINYLIFRVEIREGESTAAILNASGRQRMLLQHTALVAQELVAASSESQRQPLRGQLLDALASLEDVHYELIRFDSPGHGRGASSERDAALEKSKVQRVYFDAPWLLDTEVRNYIAQVQALTESGPGELTAENPHLRYVRDVALSRRVTGALDAVVAAYQQESEIKTAQLRRLAYWSFIATYIVLAMTGFVVFRPMVRRVRDEMDALEDLNQTLEQRVSERAALAEQRAYELELSESALRSQSRILRSILDSMGDGVVVADSQSDFQLMNRTARRLLGVGAADPQPDVRSENWTAQFGVQIFRPDQTTPYPHADLPLIRAMRGETVDRADLCLRREVDGAETWLSVTARPVVDDDGGVHGGVAVFRDVTQRKQAERELRDSEALYHSLVENLPMCVLRKDVWGRFVFANARFCELLDQPRERVIGKTDWDFYPPGLAQKYDADDRRVMARGGVFEGIEEHVTPDGRELFVEVRKSVVRDSTGAVLGTQTIFWDVTTRLQAEREREDMQQKMLQSERLAAIGHMVAGVAHESRNALQKIQACTQLLRWQLDGAGNGEVRELLSDIQHAQDRLHRLFEDLRGFAAPLRLERRRCDVQDALHRAWENVTSVADDRAAALHEEARTNDLHVFADPFQLEQVFRNLFENSLAACHGAVHVTVRYDDAQDQAPHAMRISIRDDGPGLTPEARARIFEPFFTTHTEGTGLGTAIVRRIVEAHNGQVQVGENDEPGAEFLITLPRDEP